MRKILFALAASAALAGAPAQAAIDSYIAELFGSNEVAGGDADGLGVATILIDNEANTVSWSILVLGIDLPLTGAHIHEGAAGSNGPIKIDFDAELSGAGLFDADLALITPTTASGFYVNVHNSFYPGGAVRGQLEYLRTTVVPEPANVVLMLAGLGLVGVALRRRARAS